MTLRAKQTASALVILIAALIGPLPAPAEDRIAAVKTLPVPDGGTPVAAKLDRAGTIHLLFDTTDGPRYANSTDGGKSFGALISIVDERPKKPGLEFRGADLAVGKDAVIHVALSTNAWKLKLPQNEWGVFYTNLEHGAKSFSPVRNLNGHPSEGFSLAANEKGDVTACWLSGKLYANISHDNGQTFAPHIEINPAYDPCDCCTTSSLYAADGRLGVLYREETNNERDMYLVLWDQDRGNVSRVRIGTTPWKIDACPMSCYSLSPRKNGFLAVWPTKDQICFARLDSEGNSMPQGEIQTRGRSEMRTGMLGLSADDGTALIAWKKDDQLHWQQYDSDGKPAGPIGKVHSPGNGLAGVVNAGNQFLLLH